MKKKLPEITKSEIEQCLKKKKTGLFARKLFPLDTSFDVGLAIHLSSCRIFLHQVKLVAHLGSPSPVRSREKESERSKRKKRWPPT